MAHKLHGLNILTHNSNPAPPLQHDNSSNITNALLPDPSFAGFPDLDLWTNVAFAQDEPFIPSNDPDSDDSAKDNELDRSSKDSSTAIVKKKRDLLAKQKPFEHHRGDSLSSTDASPSTAAAPASAPYDLSALLSSQFSPDAMNLNQILFANAFQPNMPFMTPFGAPPAPHPAPTPTPATSTSTNPHPAKKPRSRKTSSISFAARSEASASPAAAGMDEDHEDGSAPTGNAEDKRRRNTQASARFRLKKKEREVAMESKCKDLESKVGELERECEALRRENGWLKGLVVGVTGGTGMPMTMPTGPGLPAPMPQQQQQTGGKRKRDAAEAS